MSPLKRITNEIAGTMAAGDYVVTPHTALPFERLRITEISQPSPTGMIFFRVHRLSTVGQLGQGWTPATSFWRPPEGFRWNNTKHQWECGPKDAPTKWTRPTLRDLGVTRDSEGWLTEITDDAPAGARGSSST